MLFTIQRETLLTPLTQICGVVERKQTLPVLANVLIQATDNRLALTTSDLEVEMRSFCPADVSQAGEITVPAVKLLDICKALPDGAMLSVALLDGKCVIETGKSKFSLSTLPATEFPLIEDIEEYQHVSVKAADLKRLLAQTVFCMAVQDVRYFLNALLFDILEDKFRCVSADGHRLALAECEHDNPDQIKKQILVPRKGVLALQKMIADPESMITINIGRNHVNVVIDEVSMTSKLVDGRFPDYESVIPLNMENAFIADKQSLKRALQRVAILSNEQYRGVKLSISPDTLTIVGHNPEQEQAEEVLSIETRIEDINTAFNVNYLLDATQAIDGDQIQFSFKEALSSCLIKHPDKLNCRLVVMPLRL